MKCCSRWVFRLAVALVLTHAVPAGAEDTGSSQTAPRERVALARFSTNYALDAAHKSRAANIELATAAIDGKVISPGGIFSFNDAAFERTATFGYERSIVLREGMIRDGIGGGACQVASTLHAAALLAGLDIVMRAPHSRPSAYIRMGLDATVALGTDANTIDLKFRNSTAQAITIHAKAARGELVVSIDAAGSQKPEVSVTTEILERIPYPRVVEHDARVAKNIRLIKAFGIPGYRVRRTREVRQPNGSIKRDVRIDVYPATKEIVQIRSDDDAQSEGADDARRVVAEEATKPTLVQLRPSTRVVLNNAGTPGPSATFPNRD